MRLSLHALTALAVVSTYVLSVPVLSSAAPALVPSGSDASFCGTTTGIPAADLAGGVAETPCSLVGVPVVSPAGMQVYVPTAGTVTNETLLTTGEDLLSVTNTGNEVSATVADDENLPGAGQTEPTGPDGRPLACSEPAYNISSPDAVSPRWYYNSSTQSRSGLSGPNPLTQIRDAITNQNTGYNDCGYTSQPDISSQYEGDTSKYANINANADCTSSFPDGQDTVSWGPFNNPNILATTCTATEGTGYIQESDIYIGSNVDIVGTLPANCTSNYDLQSVMTHEWGHAYGMEHETSGAYETMYPNSYLCATFARTLGEGDFNGMIKLYGKALSS